MRQLALAALVAFPATAISQDFIHYKFDSTCTNEVINYATGPSALASNGTLQTNTTTGSYDVGMFGSCLKGGTTTALWNKVLTGWDPGVQNVTGSLTMAWFMKQRSAAAPGTALTYMMGAPSGGFRLFTGGVGSTGLYQRTILVSGGNGVNASIAQDFFLPPANFNVQAAAAAGWVHIAMVVDATAQTATWYANGAQVLQLANVPGALINAAGPFQLGYYSSGSLYDLDEFVMSFRAYSAAEILSLSVMPQGGDGDYLSGSTTQCGSLGYASTGGRPSLGNAGYGLVVTPAAASFYALLFGFDRCMYGGVLPLPLDGGLLAPIAAGCTVLTDNALSTSGFAPSGPVTVSFGLPLDPGLAGLNFYSQAIAIDLTAFTLSASSGFSIGIGN